MFKLLKMVVNLHVILAKNCFNCFIAEFTQGMILPKKEVSSTSTTSCLSNLNLNDTFTNSAKNTVKTSSEPVKLNLTNLETNSTMKCTAQDVYNALMRPEVSNR